MPPKFKSQSKRTHADPAEAKAATLFQDAFANHQNGRLTQAQELYRQVLQLQPRHFHALHFLGVIAGQTGNSAQAVDLISQAIKINPDYADAHYHLGNVLSDLNQYPIAIAAYNRTLALKPDHADAYCFRGHALRQLRQFESALASYNQAIALQPNHADAYNNLGNALRDLKQPEAALASYRQAISLKPDYAEAYYNCGVALRDIKQTEAALVVYDRAITLKPDYVDAHSNRGNALKDLRRFDEADASYDRAIALKPDYSKAYWHKSLLKLLLGDYEQGWRLYEWRWRTTSFLNTDRSYKQPLWLGEQSLLGKTLLIYGEQGLGDSLQFCRYALMAQARGAKVILEAPRKLFTLMTTLKGNVTLIEQGNDLPDFDLYCPLMSLPLAFKTTVSTIPASIPYLYSDIEKQAI